MKTTILIGTFIWVFATTVTAQSNVATLNQVGSNQTSLQSQTGVGLQSRISQDFSSVREYNLGNYSVTQQTGDFFTGNGFPNIATINQNLGTSSSKAVIDQRNHGNSGTINQNSNANTHWLGGQLVVTSNTSDAAINNALGNNGFILQDGFHSTASIDQNRTSWQNFASLQQVSPDGHGTLQQDAKIKQENSSYNNSATTRQYGTGYGVNSILVNQSDFSLENTTTVTQGANDNRVTNNRATVNQIGDGKLWSSRNNVATITQSASNNEATINQTGLDTYGVGIGTSRWNTAFISQVGASNKATILQTDYAFQNVAIINQAGTNDVAIINQITFANRSTSLINQGSLSTGNNLATITQQQTYDQGGTAIINQNTHRVGGSNIGVIVQGIPVPLYRDSDNYSSSGDVRLNQEGSFNQARMEQSGEGNTVSLTQNGNNNLIQNASGKAGSFAYQTGISNTLIIVQNGSTTGSIGNTANVSQLGYGNTATILQLLTPN